ncbi:5-(aminomethyl)-3-furanmethanol phosphate kinase [Methylomarinovum tepidoasis]|uniref:5-(Aminomethyl)-3-furanmethanol phosphate kinase n=1 Tax=Methylomarinovum tepidoasis TaxID=2840183 RepID=A0AAU9CF64_9GAMM|nr:hypothetical protein [Methylomarinovum sp. IN45]BCX89476.1 5-(aminomethyl)-3-furanmethanol phosphate kinase [Methylomarinovum sp. IN45]
MWVVKLGGSWADHDRLPHWLQALVHDGGGRVVLVPGGGPFADQVRRMQRRWRFGDRHAHRMALLAMHQYAWMLAALRPDLAPLEEIEALGTCVRQGRVPVWLPRLEDLDAAGVPADWTVTSDSLAAWLTSRLNAVGLALLKQVSVPGPNPCTLQCEGIVDAAFPRWFPRNKTLQIFAPDQLEDFREFLRRLP